jgi:hypothetical protein
LYYILVNNKSQEFDLLLVKLTLAVLKIKPSFSAALQDLLNILLMVFEIAQVNKEVIKIDDQECF